MDRRRFLKTAAGAAVAASVRPAFAADAEIIIRLSESEPIVDRHIFGHFIEHLGGVIYDGIWVGRDSKIANVDGSLWHRMGDLGYLDDDGLLWFCGRKAHRVETAEGVLYTIPCEAVFNTHPRVRRTALVGVSKGAHAIAVLCVEKLGGGKVPSEAELVAALIEIGAGHEHTRGIRRFLFHPGFPVDARHNAKIGREKLALWASKRIGSTQV